MKPNPSVPHAVHDPYAPPRAERAPVTRPLPVMHGGSHAVIVPGTPLPPLCLKCGATSGVALIPRHLLVHGGAPPKSPGEKPRSLRWVVIVMVVLVAALTVVDGLRHIGPVALAFGVVGAIVNHVSSRLRLDLPLCGPCDTRWRTGIAARGVALAGLLVGGSLASLGMYVAGGLVIAAAVALLATAKVAKRFVGAVYLSDGRVVLLGLASASAAAIVAAETTTVGASGAAAAGVGIEAE